MNEAGKMRSVILQALKKSGNSKYWLAKMVHDSSGGSVSRSTVYQYLSGKTDTSGGVLWSCLEALSMKIRD